MDSSNDKLRAEEAPLKNTDKAFVQVGKNGEPEFPKENQQPTRGDQQAPKEKKQDHLKDS